MFLCFNSIRPPSILLCSSSLTAAAAAVDLVAARVGSGAGTMASHGAAPAAGSDAARVEVCHVTRLLISVLVFFSIYILKVFLKNILFYSINTFFGINM